MTHSVLPLSLPQKSPSQAIGNPLFHIHIDAQEHVSERTDAEFVKEGFKRDMFDPVFRIFGRDGDSAKPFPHHAPIAHYTFESFSEDEFEDMWKVADRIVKSSTIRAYNEGELIVFDLPITPKPFDRTAFDQIVPRSSSKDCYISAILGEARQLPALISTRRLDPDRNGPGDRFRNGEIHLTVLEDGSEPILLELLANLSLSAPAIPKVMDGKVVRDIAFTLQAKDMAKVLRVGNLLLHLMNTIGGFTDASIKVELAIRFALFGNVDYNSHVPPILSIYSPHISSPTFFEKKMFTREVRQQVKRSRT